VSSLPIVAQEESEGMNFPQSLVESQHKRQFSRILGSFEGKCRRRNRATEE
jgi:hypothetical protein